MNLGKRPLGVVIIACLYVAAGAIGIVCHFPWPLTFHLEDVWIEAVGLAALIAGVFMLRSQNWARWLAVAWMAFHVVISFPGVRQPAVHSAFLAVIV